VLSQTSRHARTSARGKDSKPVHTRAASTRALRVAYSYVVDTNPGAFLHPRRMLNRAARRLVCERRPRAAAICIGKLPGSSLRPSIARATIESYLRADIPAPQRSRFYPHKEGGRVTGDQKTFKMIVKAKADLLRAASTSNAAQRDDCIKLVQELNAFSLDYGRIHASFSAVAAWFKTNGPGGFREAAHHVGRKGIGNSKGNYAKDVADKKYALYKDFLDMSLHAVLGINFARFFDRVDAARYIDRPKKAFKAALFVREFWSFLCSARPGTEAHCYGQQLVENGLNVMLYKECATLNDGFLAHVILKHDLPMKQALGNSNYLSLGCDVVEMTGVTASDCARSSLVMEAYVSVCTADKCQEHDCVCEQANDRIKVEKLKTVDGQTKNTNFHESHQKREILETAMSKANPRRGTLATKAGTIRQLTRTLLAAGVGEPSLPVDVRAVCAPSVRDAMHLAAVGVLLSTTTRPIVIYRVVNVRHGNSGSWLYDLELSETSLDPASADVAPTQATATNLVRVDACNVDLSRLVTEMTDLQCAIAGVHAAEASGEAAAVAHASAATKIAGGTALTAHGAVASSSATAASAPPTPAPTTASVSSTPSTAGPPSAPF